MKYPREIGPQSQTEMMAWMFGMLSHSYNLLAQYEADERHREEGAVREELIKQRERFTTAVSEREREERAAAERKHAAARTRAEVRDQEGGA